MAIDKKAEFWRSFLCAVEVEPRYATSIRGSSGFYHPVVSVGVDEKRNRVVVISGESDARSAALAHGDIQAAMPSVKVMMARPVAVNLGEAARIVTAILGTVSFGDKELDLFSEHYQKNPEQFQQSTHKILDRIKGVTGDPLLIATLNMVAVWKDIIQQLSFIEMQTGSQLDGAPDKKMPTFDLSKLVALDPAEVDRGLGVCSIPLYLLSPEEVENFQAETR